MTAELAPLADAAALERNHLARQLGVAALLRELLGYAHQALAPLHFLPDFLRLDSGRDPEHDQIVDEVRAFPHDRVAAAVHRVDHDLDGLFGELLRHLGTAGAQEPSRARARRISMPGRDDSAVEAVDRISHAERITQEPLLVVNKSFAPSRYTTWFAAVRQHGVVAFGVVAFIAWFRRCRTMRSLRSRPGGRRDRPECSRSCDSSPSAPGSRPAPSPRRRRYRRSRDRRAGYRPASRNDRPGCAASRC